MAKLSFKNKWVLITGASSGLGRSLAFYMAGKEGANLVVAARRKDRLEELKKEIEASTGSHVKIIPTDLNQPREVENLFERAVESADIYALINNAGLTFYDRADAGHMETFDKIIQVNLKALMDLTLRFLQRFNQKGEGAILNITSEAGLIAVPYQAVYSASKHAAQAFTEALYMENRKSGVVICSFAPGGIDTELLAKSGLDKKHGSNSPFNMNADKVAKLAVKAFKKKKFLSVPGILNKLTIFSVRFFPRKLVTAIAESIFRPNG
jgi:short-subunit dehydrogenase